MDSLVIKHEPQCEDNFEDFFCEEEMKVCFVTKYYCDIVTLKCFSLLAKFYDSVVPKVFVIAITYLPNFYHI